MQSLPQQRPLAHQAGLSQFPSQASEPWRDLRRDNDVRVASGFFAVLRVRPPATPRHRDGEPCIVERKQKNRATLPRAGAAMAALHCAGRTKIWPG